MVGWEMLTFEKTDRVWTLASCSWKSRRHMHMPISFQHLWEPGRERRSLYKCDASRLFTLISKVRTWHYRVRKLNERKTSLFQNLLRSDESSGICEGETLFIYVWSITSTRITVISTVHTWHYKVKKNEIGENGFLRRGNENIPTIYIYMFLYIRL